MTASPIRSVAQHSMLTKASTDHEYAASRGITSEAARDLLKRHEDAGSPKLPNRVNIGAAGVDRVRPKPRKYKLLGAP